MAAVRDALGREVNVTGTPQRIVSLVPSLTELLADLGLDDEVVGLTTFCVRPQGWRESKTRVGGTKDVRTERVLALEPDLIIANQEENTPDVVEALAKHAPVYVTQIATLDDALVAIRELGSLVARATAAENLCARIEQGFAGLAALPPLRAAYLIWRQPYMCAGGDTFIGDMLRRGGLVNVFEDRTRYPEVRPEDLRAASPDVVLLSSEPFPFKEKHMDEVRADVPGAKLILVDGQAYSWYGSRLVETPAALARLRSDEAAT